jgi:adenine-specific DNA-methyltransferase
MRDRRLAGYKFRRQQPIGPYIVDFYSAMVNLAIELDGSGHLRSDRRHLDELRSRYLHEQGIRVVRFLNSELSENIEAVLERILVEVEGRS